MEFPEQRLRRLIVAHARPDAFAPHARSILSKLGYAIVPAEDVGSLPEPFRGRTPDLRVVDEARWDELPRDGRVPMIVLTGRQGVRVEDERIVGALPRPAGLHELYRLVQLALEETPRTAARVSTQLPARCRFKGKEWQTRVLSLSETGCLLRSTEPVPLGTHVQISFDLPSSGPIDTRAETAYQMPPDLGLIFHEIAPASRRAIGEFVSQALAEL
jgi:hypothetical protein